MARKRLHSEWRSRSLTSHAALENGSVQLSDEFWATENERKRGSLAFFALGFVCAILFGAMALAMLLIISPEPARAKTLMPEAAPGVKQVANYLVTTGRASALDDLRVEGRQLWWKFPN